MAFARSTSVGCVKFYTIDKYCELVLNQKVFARCVLGLIRKPTFRVTESSVDLRVVTVTNWNIYHAATVCFYSFLTLCTQYIYLKQFHWFLGFSIDYLNLKRSIVDCGLIRRR
ncbi:MAG: hypothetical protein NT022_00630, partial [Deltaproteobacteria bacterium]|nr:hypothetical protein [Deltaproteobacteria bacterium]